MLSITKTRLSGLSGKSAGSRGHPMLLDLPIELWLEILSFLPEHYKRRVMGVSRVLFEIAMDDIYREVRLISDEDSKLFNRLREPQVSHRVRHVYIRPSFFPGAEEAKEHALASANLKCRSVSMWNKLLRPSSQFLKYGVCRFDKSDEFLNTAASTLACCTSVRHATIVVHDLSPLPSFTPFLQTLRKSIGKDLRKLTVDITHAKLPLILDPSTAHELKNLQDLEVRLAYSRFKLPVRGTTPIQEALLPFIREVGKTLVSLTLSSSATELKDLTPFFKDIGFMPYLRKFDLSIVLSNVDSVTDRAALTAFVAAHQDYLEELSLRGVFDPSTRAYGAWIQDDFPTLFLSSLQTLTFGTCDASYPWQPPSGTPVDLSHLPRLESLAIIDVTVPDTSIVAFLSSIPRSYGAVCSALRRLQITIPTMCDSLVDTLANLLPALEHLDLTYHGCSMGYGDFAYTYSTFHSPSYEAFREVMESRRYPHWKLQHLRLAMRMAVCGQGHPELDIMVAVAKCLPTRPSFGLDRQCFCII